MSKLNTDGKIYRFDQIDFETNLTVGEVIKIVEEYLNTLEESYEIDRRVVYDTKSLLSDEPVWYVFVAPLRMKEAGFLDSDESIAVSDKRACLVYITNSAGRITEEF